MRLPERFDVFGLQRDTRRHGCPPNLMSKSPHAQMASNSEKPSMLLPLPFASVSPREMIMHGLPQRSVTRDATMPITPWCQFHRPPRPRVFMYPSLRYPQTPLRQSLLPHGGVPRYRRKFPHSVPRFLFIAADEQAHGAFRRAHTARRVDARHKRKRHIRARQCLPCNACVFQKCLHARAVAL